MPHPTFITFAGMSRDGFAGSPEPIEGSIEEIQVQDQQLCLRYGFPKKRAQYLYRYRIVPSAAAERTLWPLLPAPVEDQDNGKGWRNMLLRRIGLNFRRKPKQRKWYDVMEDRLADENVKYECVARSRPSGSVRHDWTSGQSPHHPAPEFVEFRYVVEVGGHKRVPSEDEMWIWRNYAGECKARGQKPGYSVPVEGWTLRRIS